MPVETPNKPILSPDEIEAEICRHMRYALGRDCETLSERELFWTIALAARDKMVDGMLATEKRYTGAKAKRLYYLSMEFLMGRTLGNTLINLGLWESCRVALEKRGMDIDEVRESEPDAALGNGGLGRLAACFLDSLAALGMPGFGYGINYEYGLFKQEIQLGYQVEKPDNWLSYGTPWQIERPDEAVLVPAYGHVETREINGRYTPIWVDTKPLIGVPHDMPVPGYGGTTVNYLRLYSARSAQEFDMQVFNAGDYQEAVAQQIATQTISKVLYPSDIQAAGKELRLLQEYFLVACALHDIVRRYRLEFETWDEFPNQVAMQMNDTHPAISVAELMRVFVDVHGLDWDKAWELTTGTLGYTNHTLLSEALERWSVGLFEYVLPRHLQIIFEINRRFLESVAVKWPNDGGHQIRMSIIEEGADKKVRMAHLAIVGSHSVNGVSALHSELIKSSLVPDFYQLWPEKFNNKTNGVTPRRWLLKANPGLASLITETIGDGWITDLEKLHGLEPFAEDASFQTEFNKIKSANKTDLAAFIQETQGITLNPDSLFDVQVKRIHEYKRQLLSVMHVIHEYLSLIQGGIDPTVPRTYVFAGKAAPGYWAAKQIIKLINSVSYVVNSDPRTAGKLAVVFVPDYRVSVAEKIIPAANLSEQISTAGKEASGTGCMKLAMNGALTMGTLDGANIEIKEEVGDDNIFIFGLTADQIQTMRSRGTYHPWDYYSDPATKRVLDALNSDLFCPNEPGLFRWIFESLLNGGDEYFHLADFPSYLKAQREAGSEYQNAPIWTRKAILNVARTGKFSSDRTIAEYAKDIWGIKTH
ncbi:MAG: glycogen/starch/alpha-glucan phosphorylase [Janthinobacterium lividum]